MSYKVEWTPQWILPMNIPEEYFWDIHNVICTKNITVQSLYLYTAMHFLLEIFHNSSITKPFDFFHCLLRWEEKHWIYDTLLNVATTFLLLSLKRSSKLEWDCLFIFIGQMIDLFVGELWKRLFNYHVDCDTPLPGTVRYQK